MNREDILAEIEQVKADSKNVQASLLVELKFLETQEKSTENSLKMTKLCCSHAKDLYDTSHKIGKLEIELKKLQ